jgi:adenylylsulfate kinase-like enzyme
MREIVVTIQGPAGSGKTQIANALASMLRNNGVPVTLVDDGGVRAIDPRAGLNLPADTTVQVKVPVRSEQEAA